MILSQIPHLYAKDILPKECQYVMCMENFAGILKYLLSWVWVDEGTIRGNGGSVFSMKALPLIIEFDGTIIFVVPHFVDHAVFHNARLAYQYLMHIARSDLKYRGFRDDRLSSFEYKQEANFVLYSRVLTADVHEYELL